MKSPLKYDQDRVEEFGIDDAQNEVLDPVYKIAYVRSQLEEISKFLYRERVELILAETQATSDVSHIVANAKVKVEDHRNNIKGIVKSIATLKQLLNELQAAHTE